MVEMLSFRGNLHNTRPRPQFFGKSLGKTLGKGQKECCADKEKRAELLVFQRDCSVAKIFQKKYGFPERFPESFPESPFLLYKRLCCLR
jgi:hypothetical protein